MIVEWKSKFTLIQKVESKHAEGVTTASGDHFCYSPSTF